MLFWIRNILVFVYFGAKSLGCVIIYVLLNVKGFLNELYVFILCNLIWWKRIIILSVYILIMVCEDVFINEFNNLSNFL